MAERALAQIPPWHNVTDLRVHAAEFTDTSGQTVMTSTATEETIEHNGSRVQIAVENPATGEVIGHVPERTASEVAELARRAGPRNPPGRRWGSRAADESYGECSVG